MIYYTRCPQCGSQRTGSGGITFRPDGSIEAWSKTDSHCSACSLDLTKEHLFMDVAELRKLIIEAKKRPHRGLMFAGHITSWYGTVLEAVEAYLNGDTKILKEFAEEEE